MYPKRQFLAYQKLRKIVQKLDIKNQCEYFKRYKEIPGAPNSPSRAYKQTWKGWLPFLGKPIKLAKISYIKCQKAAIKLGIKSQSEYFKRYKEIPCARCRPDQVYKTEWKGWNSFLKKPIKVPYLSYKKCQKAVITLGISTQTQYGKYQHYKKIHGAPAHPNEVYKTDWEGWEAFLGMPNKIPCLSYEELQKAVHKLKIRFGKEYIKRYKEIPGAPSNPQKIYKKWKGWEYLLKKSPKIPYISYKKCQKEVIRLCISTIPEYLIRYKEIPGAPRNLSLFYKNTWKGWYCFTNKNQVHQIRQILHNIGIVIYRHPKIIAKVQ